MAEEQHMYSNLKHPVMENIVVKIIVIMMKIISMEHGLHFQENWELFSFLN